MIALYSRSMKASEWRAILDKIESKEFRTQLIEELQKHSDNDMIAVRFDHLLVTGPETVSESQIVDIIEAVRQAEINWEKSDDPGGMTYREICVREVISQLSLLGYVKAATS